MATKLLQTPNKQALAKRKRITSPSATEQVVSKRPVLGVITNSQSQPMPSSLPQFIRPGQPVPFISAVPGALTDAEKLARFEKFSLQVERLKAQNEKLNQ